MIGKLHVLRGEIRIPQNQTIVEFNDLLDNTDKTKGSLRVTSNVLVESCELFEIDTFRVYGPVSGNEDKEIIRTSGQFRIEPLFLTCEVRFRYRSREGREREKKLKLFGHTNKPLIIDYDMSLVYARKKIFFSHFDTKSWPVFKYIMKRTGQTNTFKDVANKVLKNVPHKLMHTLGHWLLDFIQDQFDEHTEFPTEEVCSCLSPRSLRRDGHIKHPIELSDDEMIKKRVKPRAMQVIDLHVPHRKITTIKPTSKLFSNKKSTKNPKMAFKMAITKYHNTTISTIMPTKHKKTTSHDVTTALTTIRRTVVRKNTIPHSIRTVKSKAAPTNSITQVPTSLSDSAVKEPMMGNDQEFPSWKIESTTVYPMKKVATKTSTFHQISSTVDSKRTPNLRNKTHKKETTTAKSSDEQSNTTDDSEYGSFVDTKFITDTYEQTKTMDPIPSGFKVATSLAPKATTERFNLRLTSTLKKANPFTSSTTATNLMLTAVDRRSVALMPSKLQVKETNNTKTTVQSAKAASQKVSRTTILSNACAGYFSQRTQKTTTMSTKHLTNPAKSTTLSTTTKESTSSHAKSTGTPDHNSRKSTTPG